MNGWADTKYPMGDKKPRRSKRHGGLAIGIFFRITLNIFNFVNYQ